ncbi:MAG: lytic murein transglycosylase [Pseudomonadales bacterium]
MNKMRSCLLQSVSMVWLSALFMLIIATMPVQVRAEDQQAFDVWLEDIKNAAIERGISEKTVEQALDDLEPDPRVIGFDRNQPEFKQTFDEYLTARVTDDRIKAARQYYREHFDTLQAIADRYEVDPQYLVAFWGLESSFGRHQGTYSVVRSLATLAFDPRRSEYFTNELFAALRILDEGHVPLDKFVGGWAGAMGQNQFLPSSFLNYAQDFDGDGRKDIWSSRKDVWASIANYLSRNGWERGAGWGMPARMTRSLDFDQLKPEQWDTRCRALGNHTRKLPLSRWQEMGLEISGNAPPADNEYALIIPEERVSEEDVGRVFLVGGNFRTILNYNCANIYAVSVGLLADTIMSSRPERSVVERSGLEISPLRYAPVEMTR